MKHGTIKTITPGQVASSQVASGQVISSEANTSEVTPVVSASVAQETKSASVNYRDFCDAFRRREDSLTLLHQLHQLIKAVQRHRGISMGLLAGDKDFLPEFNVLQSQLERRLATLETFAHSTGGLLSDRDKENLHLAWVTIRQNWQDDDISDNFELHSHFIHQLLCMSFNLAKTLEGPLFEDMQETAELNRKSISYPIAFSRIELLNFIGKQMPEMIEQIAKLRGLSTYAASSQNPAELMLGKLRYLLQAIQEHSERVRQQADRLHMILLGAVASLKKIKDLELKLMFLINTVENDVLINASPKTDSHQLFDLATEIIEVYWEVVGDGFILVRKWHQGDIDVWAKMSP